MPASISQGRQSTAADRAPGGENLFPDRIKSFAIGLGRNPQALEIFDDF
jgi:hypothetical protein